MTETTSRSSDDEPRTAATTSDTHDYARNEAGNRRPINAPDRRPTRKKRTSGKRESGTGTMTSKQTDPPPAPANRQQARASHDPEGGGTSRSKQIGKSRGEGQGERKRRMKGHGEHGHLIISSSHHLIISSPALPTLSKHRITPPTQPSPHQRNPHDAPVAIPSLDEQPPQPYHIGAVPVPRRHLIRSSRTGRTIEARQMNHGTAPHQRHGHDANATPRATTS